MDECQEDRTGQRGIPSGDAGPAVPGWRPVAVREAGHENPCPAAEKQARPFLLVELQRLTRDRLERYGNTIFHLEPNVKEAPGGLRDFHSTLWMRQLAGDRRDPRFSPVNEDELTRNAVEFLSAIRCFLHYSNGRNDNTLTYELQAQAAERSLGIDDNLRRNAAEWMRLYFRHARTLNRQLLRYVDQRPPATLSLRQRLMNATHWRPSGSHERQAIHGARWIAGNHE